MEAENQSHLPESKIWCNYTDLLFSFIISHYSLFHEKLFSIYVFLLDAFILGIGWNCFLLSGVRLKPNPVVQLLIELLEDDSGCEMFGVEFTNVVMREMLNKRRFWCYLDRKISDGKWTYSCIFITQYTLLFTDHYP